MQTLLKNLSAVSTTEKGGDRFCGLARMAFGFCAVTALHLTKGSCPPRGPNSPHMCNSTHWGCVTTILTLSLASVSLSGNGTKLCLGMGLSQRTLEHIEADEADAGGNRALDPVHGQTLEQALAPPMVLPHLPHHLVPGWHHPPL